MDGQLEVTEAIIINAISNVPLLITSIASLITAVAAWRKAKAAKEDTEEIKGRLPHVNGHADPDDAVEIAPKRDNDWRFV